MGRFFNGFSLPYLHVWDAVMGMWCRRDQTTVLRATLGLVVPPPKSLLLSVAKGGKEHHFRFSGPSPLCVPMAVLASAASLSPPVL